MHRYPEKWREPVPGRVFACLRRGEIKIVVMPGSGMLDGGVLHDIPIDLVSFELRMPNTNVWLRFDESFKVTTVWRRDGDV